MCVVSVALPWTREHNRQFRSYLLAKYSSWTSIPTIIAGHILWWVINIKLLFTLVAFHLFHFASRAAPRAHGGSSQRAATLLRHFKQGSCLQHGPDLPAFTLLSYEQLQVEHSLRYLLLASLRWSTQLRSFRLKRYWFIALLSFGVWGRATAAA
jgi:hypothetical protein